MLELIDECSKVKGYNINTHKFFAFLHINNEKLEKEIKETIPFTIAKKKGGGDKIPMNKPTKETKKSVCKEL